MTGLILIATSALFEEINSSLGKRGVSDKKQSIYTMGFLQYLWAAIFFLALIFLIPKGFFAAGFPAGFVFSKASIPILLFYVPLEILQAHITVLAITQANRSTFGFLRTLTLPLLLIVDIILGYSIGTNQMVGIGLIIVSLIILFMNHGIEKKGAGIVLFTAINAVVTLSFYKYIITNFNSVEAVQVIVLTALAIYFLIASIFIAKENPLSFLRQRIFFIQSFSYGLAVVLASFAYLLAPASIITAGKRSFSVLWTIISGNVYFREKNLFVKIASLLLLIVGLIFFVR